MNGLRLITQAAQNNAEWCEIICQAHDVSGFFTDNAWFNTHIVPARYPNVVTLKPSDTPDSQESAIGDFIKQRAGSWSVKDSFNDLDLTRFDFKKLFEGKWITAPKNDAENALPTGKAAFRIVVNSDDLKKWELAWGGDAADRLFLPKLLEDERVRFLACWLDGEVLAGAILNASKHVVGVSNVFYPAGEAPRYWCSIINRAQHEFPGLPIVGYEHGQELLAAEAADLRPIGRMSVWVSS